MEQQTNISLLSVLLFSVNNAADRPITFKYGDKFNVDITIRVLPSSSGMRTISRLIVNNVKKLDNEKPFKAISKLQYSYPDNDQKIIKTLEAYSTEFKFEESQLYFEIKNKFAVNSKILPTNLQQREDGSFSFSIDWLLPDLFKGNILTTELPIIEQTALEK